MSNLQQITRMVSELQDCETAIASMNKVAAILSNNKTAVHLSMTIRDISAEEAKQAIVDFDEHGFLRQKSGGFAAGSMQQMLYNHISGAIQLAPKVDGTIKTDLTDVEALEVLAIVLRGYEAKRAGLRIALIKLGIKLR